MRRYFVQFPHPGVEGGSERSEWSRGDTLHVRKFVGVPGSYRTPIDGANQSGEITFWAEWEAASVCEALDYAGVRPKGAPSYLHRPLPPVPEQRPRGVPQNTDPFVFGDRFLYTFCAQPRVQAKRIHELAPGSVIVFGSVLHRRFVCDTVFVVKDVLRHSVLDWRDVLDDRVPDAFRLTTLEPMYAWRPPVDRVFSLYTGVTADDPLDGMYSFVPCLPVKAVLAGLSTSLGRLRPRHFSYQQSGCRVQPRHRARGSGRVVASCGRGCSRGRSCLGHPGRDPIRDVTELDAATHLGSLVGKTIPTLTGKPNRVLEVRGGEVIVGTDRSPAGQPVPVGWVQDAIEELLAKGEIEISVETVGYRSAFIGAVLATLPGATTLTNPHRVRIEQGS